MNKKVIVLTILALIGNSLFSIGIGSNWNNESISDSKGSLNPANLSYRDEDSPTFDSYLLFDDTYNSDNVASYLQNPESKLGITFYGTSLSLSLEANNYLDDREEVLDEGIVKYRGYNKYSLGIGWGYKFGNLALGLSIKGGSQLLKTDYKLRSNGFALSDYFVETFFSSYQPVTSAQFFNVGLGGRFVINNRIALAFISDGEFDVNSSSITDLNLSKYFERLCIGVSGISDEYSFAGELKFLRIRFFGDMLYVGDDENRETRISSEFRFQLSKSFYSSIYIGIQEKQPSLIDIVTLDPSSATSHYGLDLNWLGYNILFNVAIPFDYYTGEYDVDDNIKATVKFSFQM
jgi:hypothetical protein